MINSKYNFIKNYFTVFLLTYIVLIITKVTFFLYLKQNFLEFEFAESIYAIFWGYKFDFATSAVVAFFTVFFDFNKRFFSIFSALFISSIFLTQIGDILYFNESSRHIGYEITDTFTDAKSLFMTAYSQHNGLTIASIIFALVLFIFTQRYILKLDSIKFNKFFLLKKIVLIVLTIFFIRGMTQSIPLNPWQSNQIGDSKLASLSLNATYNIVYSLANKKKKLQRVKIPRVSEEIVKSSFSQLYSSDNVKVNLPLINSKPNVIFLFLESWSAKYLQPYGYTHNTTPNFNAVLKKSMRPKVMIAGGHRTTEGMFCTLTSLQNPLGKSVAKTQLQNFKYSSIIDILNNNGYSSAFFQGSSKETSGTGSFAQSLGFKYSYGKRDVKKRLYKENYWGVHDQDLYRFALDKLGTTLREPFVLGLNGATTHDDKIPQDIKKIDFVKDENINNQLNALHFSDEALKSFIDEVELKYPNTIFVIFADHCGGNISGSLENYMIPFAIYSQKLIEAKKYDVYLSQRDIAPTVYDLIIGNYKESKVTFSGKSLLSDSEYFADYYHNGILGWIENDNLIELNSVTNIMKCYQLVSLKKEQRECSGIHQELKSRALSFTNVSQKLLFEDKIVDLKKYIKQELGDNE